MSGPRRGPGREPEIVYRDSHLLVVSKPAGLLTIASDNERERTLYRWVTERVRPGRVFIVHRLDRDTSGLLVFARSPEAKRRLQERWDEIVTERAYLAMAQGLVTPESGTIRSVLRETRTHLVYSVPWENAGKPGETGKPAVTHYQTVQGGGGFTLLRVTLETGRKNQIRVHLNDIGHPVAGDKKYGRPGNPLGRLGLHACALAFTHPFTGQALRFERDAPREFYRVTR